MSDEPTERDWLEGNDPRTTQERRDEPTERDVDALDGPCDSDRGVLAELLSWTSGEMTRYRPSAHPDHNHWSWRGAGHGEAVRQPFLDQAEALLDSGVYVSGSKALAERIAEARREGAAEVAASGADLIAAERRRQIEDEGWTAEHDREHGPSMLARAARCYEVHPGPEAWCPSDWPWHESWWKPKDHVSNLIRAGALYQAALDVGGEPHLVPMREEAVARCASYIDAIRAALRSADA